MRERMRSLEATASFSESGDAVWEERTGSSVMQEVDLTSFSD